MSRRARAVAFLLAALLAALAAAAVADRYGSRVAGGYGALRPVLVAASELRRGQQIEPRVAARWLEVRRVPARFVPPGALAHPTEATGLEPLATIPVGAYLLAAQLRPPGRRGGGARLGRGRRPVQVEVSGAEALSFAGGPGGAVDVVVTTEPGGSGRGRTYIAAAGVPLLALAPSSEGPGGGLAAATLALTRSQALRLIAAESFARRVTVLPR